MLLSPKRDTSQSEIRSIGQFRASGSLANVMDVGVVDIDIVIVSYNSAAELRNCIEPLSGIEGMTPIVVDNASSDGSLETLHGLGVVEIACEENGGFARGSNIGWRRGTSKHVLFLNPDSEIQPLAVLQLSEALDADPTLGAVAPKILNEDGTLAFSLRRFPRLRSTFAQALFLHRAFPRARWTDELVRDNSVYSRACSPEWVSGACVMVRRDVLEELGGWDERFFLFSEDIDLCKRIREAGWELRYEPYAICVHVGGASAPKAVTLPLLAQSRLRYVQKHHGTIRQLLERVGMALSALTHAAVGRGARGGHVRALLVSTRIDRTGRPSWPVG